YRAVPPQVRALPPYHRGGGTAAVPLKREKQEVPTMTVFTLGSARLQTFVPRISVATG
ncbi:hypothetical protein G3I76_38930, partial [Streptomyces sp. SID11233]|nr:hypothetical protein [Streptomyces sp. SID11233]